MNDKDKMVINIPVKKPKDHDEIYESNKEYLPSNINEEDNKNRTENSYISQTDKTVITEDIQLIENKKMNMSRFVIGHKLKNKQLDNSQEDILCFEVVDEKGYEEFKRHSYGYFLKKAMEKGKKLSEYMRYYIKTSVIGCIEKIPFNYFTIMKEVIERSEDVPRKSKGDCCKKPRILNKIQCNYEYKTMCFDIRKNLISFKKQLSGSGEPKLEGLIVPEFYTGLINDYLETKINVMFEFNCDKLKDEVDKYWEYFNLETILSKQISKIEAQKTKLNSLEEFKMMNDCIICMESERNVIFRPCLHLICCETCGFGKIGMDCPECHTKIESKQIVMT